MSENFDQKQFAELLELAKGEKRSMNEFAKNSGVVVSYISRLLRAVNEAAPSPQIIRKFADIAINGVTYEQLMQAAGHLNEDDMGNNEKLPDHGIREMMIAKEEMTSELYDDFVVFVKRARKVFVESPVI